MGENQPFHFKSTSGTGEQPFTCPVCNGQGSVQRPPWVAGDQEIWETTGTNAHTCPACHGKGIVWR